MKITDNQIIVISAIAVFAFIMWDGRNRVTSPNGETVKVAPTAIDAQPTDASAGAGSVLQDVSQTTGVVSTNSIPVISSSQWRMYLRDDR